MADTGRDDRKRLSLAANAVAALPYQSDRTCRASNMNSKPVDRGALAAATTPIDDGFRRLARQPQLPARAEVRLPFSLRHLAHSSSEAVDATSGAGADPSVAAAPAVSRESRGSRARCLTGRNRNQ